MEICSPGMRPAVELFVPLIASMDDCLTVITSSRFLQFSSTKIAVVILVSDAGAAFWSAFLSKMTAPLSRLIKRTILALVSSSEL